LPRKRGGEKATGKMFDMATRKVPDSIPSTLTPHKAIELRQQRIAAIGRITTLPRGDPEYQKWRDTTEAVLDGAFGKPDGQPHQMTSKFTLAGVYLVHGERLRQQKAGLESAIEQLKMLAPPAATVAVGQYQFHVEVERVSGDLFRDGHYKQAALEAYIRVIDEVKRRSGLNLDGDDLVNQAFGCNNRIPPLKFNALSTDAEKDEQKGFLFLFKGIVGLRNSKAHSNRLFNDPARAHEYLALASLLMRVLELAS
jgi:uncharacterized protein (TIGR02391 family)